MENKSEGERLVRFELQMRNFLKVFDASWNPGSLFLVIPDICNRESILGFLEQGCLTTIDVLRKLVGEGFRRIFSSSGDLFLEAVQCVVLNLQRREHLSQIFSPGFIPFRFSLITAEND